MVVEDFCNKKNWRHEVKANNAEAEFDIQIQKESIENSNFASLTGHVPVVTLSSSSNASISFTRLGRGQVIKNWPSGESYDGEEDGFIGIRLKGSGVVSEEESFPSVSVEDSFEANQEKKKQDTAEKISRKIKHRITVIDTQKNKREQLSSSSVVMKVSNSNDSLQEFPQSCNIPNLLEESNSTQATQNPVVSRSGSDLIIPKSANREKAFALNNEIENDNDKEDDIMCIINNISTSLRPYRGTPRNHSMEILYDYDDYAYLNYTKPNEKVPVSTATDSSYSSAEESILNYRHYCKNNTDDDVGTTFESRDTMDDHSTFDFDDRDDEQSDGRQQDSNQCKYGRKGHQRDNVEPIIFKSKYNKGQVRTTPVKFDDGIEMEEEYYPIVEQGQVPGCEPGCKFEVFDEDQQAGCIGLDIQESCKFDLFDEIGSYVETAIKEASQVTTALHSSLQNNYEDLKEKATKSISSLSDNKKRKEVDKPICYIIEEQCSHDFKRGKVLDEGNNNNHRDDDDRDAIVNSFSDEIFHLKPH